MESPTVNVIRALAVCPMPSDPVNGSSFLESAVVTLTEKRALCVGPTVAVSLRSTPDGKVNGAWFFGSPAARAEVQRIALPNAAARSVRAMC